MDSGPGSSNAAVAFKLKRELRKFEIENCTSQKCGNANLLKECREYANFDLEYINFLSCFINRAESGGGNDRCSNVHGDDVDPQYRIFLESLKEDGKSYVLEPTDHNGLVLPLRYEEQLIKESIEASAENVNAPRADAGGKNNGFPSLLQLDRDVNAVNISGIGGSNKLKLEKDAMSDFHDCVSVPLLQLESSNQNPSMENQDVFEMLEKCNMPHVLSVKRKKRSARTFKSFAKRRKAETVLDDYKYIVNDHQITEQGVISSKSYFLCDEDDLDSDAAEIDLEIFEKEGIFNPFVPSKVFGEIDHDNKQTGSAGASLRSEFRMKLLSILHKPFDPEEYKNLKRDICARKRIECHRELRGGMDRNYASQKRGKSYLDYYKDFKQKLKAANGDYGKELNLLRGFFFYMQNITQPDAFQPWKDKCILAVMPAST